MGGGSRSQLSPRDKLRYLCGTKIQDVGNFLRRVAAERSGPVNKKDLAQALQACDIAVPEDLLNKVWPKLEQNSEGNSDIWQALSGLAPPRVGIQIERLVGKIGRVQEAQGRAIMNKNYKQAAELNRTERRFCEELEHLPLDSDISSSAHKVQERELLKQVRNASTSLMRQNAEAALARFRELMKVGHTPRASPRGGSFVVVDYERPRTSNINMIIDMLPPDNHQAWRGSLRKGQLGLWKDKHDRVTTNYQEIESKYKYQKERAHALAFNKAPFPPQAAFERMRMEEEENNKGAAAANSPDRLSSLDNRVSSPLGSRPNTMNGSRPGTSASIMSRPYTSSGSKGAKSDMFLAVQAFVERARAAGQSPAAALGDMAGASGFVTREQLEKMFHVEEEANNAVHVETLISNLDRGRTGKVGVEAVVGAIIAALGPSEVDGKLWRHPSRGFVSVSGRMWDLLQALQVQIKKRWHRGAEDTFAMQDRNPSHPLEKRDLQAVIDFFAVHAGSAEVKEIWDFLQDPDSTRAASWSDFKTCFNIEGNNGENTSTTQYAVSSPQGASRRLGSKVSKRGRSKSTPPEETFATEEEEIADLMSSTYNRFYAQEDEIDYFSPYGPLRHRGYHKRPESRMRPLTSDPAAGSPQSKSKRGVQWNVAGDPTPPRKTDSTSLRQSTPDQGTPVGAMISPFTNFGSSLRMPWRRWAGGETIGVAKLPLQDPAAPGLTASLVPGTGEFKKSYDERVKVMKEYEASLTREDSNLSQSSLSSLFPTGLSPGLGAQPLRPPSRASTAYTLLNTDGPSQAAQPATSKIKAVSNAQGFLRKEMEDRGTAALIGRGTFWRDVGPPWEAVSNDIGGQSNSPMPPLYELPLSKRAAYALKADRSVSPA